MKEQQLEALEERSANIRKIGTPNVKGRKYKGNPHMKLKKVKTENSAIVTGIPTAGRTAKLKKRTANFLPTLIDQ